MDQSLQKEIQEKQLVCVLNNTKWRELIKKIEHLGSFGPKCSIHYFFDARSPYSFQYIRWEEFLQDCEYIQYVILQCEKDISELRFKSLKQILKDINISFSLDGENIKIWGYYSPSERPDFFSEE